MIDRTANITYNLNGSFTHVVPNIVVTTYTGRRRMNSRKDVRRIICCAKRKYRIISHRDFICNIGHGCVMNMCMCVRLYVNQGTSLSTLAQSNYIHTSIYMCVCIYTHMHSSCFKVRFTQIYVLISES
jgi:hypothetical protein